MEVDIVKQLDDLKKEHEIEMKAMKDSLEKDHAKELEKYQAALQDNQKQVQSVETQTELD